MKMNLFEKLTNILMPMEDVMEEEVVEAKPAAVQSEAVSQEEVRKVVNGDNAVYTASAPAPAARPQLTVHTTKIPELKVQIYVPLDFDQVTSIADDLKSGKAAIVNYERVDSAEQRRICDFVNGVCYVMNGEARRISELMVLYVPEGVSVSEASPLPSFKEK